MSGRSDAKLLFVLLSGSAVLVAFAVSRLPTPRDWFQLPSTPLDRHAVRSAVPAFRLLSEAAAVIPHGASVAVRSEPPDPNQDTSLHRMAVGLLPGRRVLPFALWGMPRPDIGQAAQFLVVIGPKPAPSPGRLILELPYGTVWEKRAS